MLLNCQWDVYSLQIHLTTKVSFVSDEQLSSIREIQQNTANSSYYNKTFITMADISCKLKMYRELKKNKNNSPVTIMKN